MRRELHTEAASGDSRLRTGPVKGGITPALFDMGGRADAAPQVRWNCGGRRLRRRTRLAWGRGGGSRPGRWKTAGGRLTRTVVLKSAKSPSSTRSVRNFASKADVCGRCDDGAAAEMSNARSRRQSLWTKVLSGAARYGRARDEPTAGRRPARIDRLLVRCASVSRETGGPWR